MTTIHVAAVGDIHFGPDAAGTLRPHLEHLGQRADLLLLAGDLTRVGTADEAQALADELSDVDIPMVAVLGNHDYHGNEPDKVQAILEGIGVTVLEGDSVVIPVNGSTVGVAGTKGFGGGFVGACGSEFGEPEMKAFMAHSRCLAERLEQSLAALDTDVKVALLHYAPCPDTLMGERLEIYPFLGCYLLGEAVDRGGAALTLHGHAHRGTERGLTAGGRHVRNVAQPVIGHAYQLYCLRPDGAAADPECAAPASDTVLTRAGSDRP
jgi:Icc-related predicted phosphoesterase